MKYGMNLLLWTTHVTAEHFPLLEQLKEAGFDGVEIPLFEGDAAHYTMIAEELKKQGLACTTVTIATPEANPISPNPAIRQAALTRLRWATEVTAILGGTTLCGPYHSAIGVFSGAGPTIVEKESAADVLREAGECAAQHEVMLAVEYLNRFECYFLTTALQAKNFVRRVGHPNVRGMYDTFHANIEEKSPEDAIQILGDSVAHVHISESDRGVPGTGMVRWSETFAALRSIKYDGWFVIEAFGRALPDLAAATKVWRDLFKSPQEVYTHGLRLMKQYEAKPEEATA